MVTYNVGKNYTYMRLDVCSKQSIHQSVVIVKSSLIDMPSGAVWKYPWPGYGETIMSHFKLL